jgi:hypothetical protein
MIKAPQWCKGATPTVKGWTDPKTGELLKSQKFSKKQVAEWHDAVDGIGKKQDIAQVAAEPELDVQEVEFDEQDFDLDEE